MKCIDCWEISAPSIPTAKPTAVVRLKKSKNGVGFADQFWTEVNESMTDQRQFSHVFFSPKEKWDGIQSDCTIRLSNAHPWDGDLLFAPCICGVDMGTTSLKNRLLKQLNCWRKTMNGVIRYRLVFVRDDWNPIELQGKAGDEWWTIIYLCILLCFERVRLQVAVEKED